MIRFSIQRFAPRPSVRRSVAAAALVLGIGAIGAELSGEEEKEVTRENTSTLESSGTELLVLSDPDFSLRLEDFANLEDYPSEFDRSLAFDEALLGANAPQLMGLLTKSSSIKPHSMQVAMRESLFRRLAMLDPIQALELAANLPQHQRRRMRAAIFQEWASIEFDSLIEHLSAQRSPNRSVAFEAIVEIGEDLSNDEKMSLSKRIHLEQFIAEGAIYQSRWESMESIESIWREATKSGTSSPMELTLLGRKWVDTVGLEALGKIKALTPNWRTRRSILRYAMGHAGQSDPKATFEYSLDLFGDTDWPLVEEAAVLWVRREPERALRAISELEPNRLHMELYGAAVEDWASLDPRIVLEYLDELPEELREDALVSALSNVTDYATEEVTQLVTEFKREGRYQAIEAILESWKEYAFDDAIDWVLSNGRPDRREPEGLDVVLDDLSSIEAEIAFEKAQEQPVDENEIGLEADVLSYFAMSNFDKAIAWLPLVRNAETRFEASAKIGLRSMMYWEWDRAITLAGKIPTTERKDYFKRIIPAWFSFSLGDPTDQIEALPDSESQSKYALMAVMYGLSTTMSESLLAKTRFYLSTEDLERIHKVEELLVAP